MKTVSGLTDNRSGRDLSMIQHHRKHSTRRAGGRGWRSPPSSLWHVLLIGLFLLAPITALSQTATITPNYKDADIRQIIEAVSEVTGQNFIIDPRVKAQVTMLSSTPMSADAFYQAFLSILQVHGYVAVKSGDLIKILPDANARQVPANDLPGGSLRSTDELVTQVIRVQNIGAAQLVPILRPLIPQYGHLAAHPASNMLIISDRAANVNRMLRIIKRIDQAGDAEIEVIRLEHASASDLVRIVTSLNQASGRGDAAGAGGTRMVADERTNSVLISGDEAFRLRTRALIAHLDTPLESGGNTQVIYLRYADAEDLAGRLKEQADAAVAGAAGGAAGAGGAPSRRQDDVVLWADPATNALVITAPPETMRTLKSVIAQLDIRRAQVLVEAIVAEVSYNRAAQLGVSWIIDGSKGGNIVGLTNFTSALNVAQVGGAVLPSGDGDPNLADLAAAIPDGISLAGGRFDSDNGTNWAVILRALLGDATTNVMAEASILTLDNEEAEISVGQEVPFVTGSFTNTGAAQGSVNPFQTIQREDVGLKLKITPQINDGDALILEIELENSNLSQSTSAVDLITNERSITQKVLIENGQLLIMGGLVDDQILEIDEKVPYLGDIPWLGRLFKSQSSTVTKRTLMVLIRPVIIRDEATATYLTNQKYRLIRDVQYDEVREGKVLMMKDEKRPMLPENPDDAGPQMPPAAGTEIEPVLDGLDEAIENTEKP